MSDVTRIYSGFRGCDFRGLEVNLHRSPDCLNVWKDYRKTESICTRPGMAIEAAFDSPVYGVFFYKGEMIVHSEGKLFKIVNGEKSVLYDASPLNYEESSSFIHNDIWYFKDGKHYLQYNGKVVTDVVGYIPTTSIARKPEGGGKVHEDVNMLSDFRKNSFLGDGEAKEFHLDARNIDEDFLPIVTKIDAVNGEVILIGGYTVDYKEGVITFDKAPAEPATDGQDNVFIQFKKAVPIKEETSNYRECILNCRLVQMFDNRVFFSGNPDYPNKLWHSSLNDPTYVSDDDRYDEGVDTAAVKGMVAGNNALWVFREPSDANTTVFYHNPALDVEYGKVYPSVHSSIALGCVGKAINFNDDIVFFSERGMEGISGDVTTEQVVAHRSSMIDSKLREEPRDSYKRMVLAEWEGYLFVFFGYYAYLADSRAVFQNENHYEYEWFRWRLESSVTCAAVHDGELYLGTVDGVYKMTDTMADVESWWVTPVDKFGYPNMLKTTNKRGCVIEAEGDISVSVKTEDSGFELIGTYKGVKDYFVSRIKRKKFKDIQLKFHSETGFSLETVTLECFIGGYIKR